MLPPNEWSSKGGRQRNRWELLGLPAPFFTRRIRVCEKERHSLDTNFGKLSCLCDYSRRPEQRKDKAGRVRETEASRDSSRKGCASKDVTSVLGPFGKDS